jgi:Zn-dependent protease
MPSRSRQPAVEVAGFRVAISWSALAVFALITWSLATRALPGSFPGHPPTGYWLAGLTTAALFVAGLLAHELAHAVVARRAGLQVDDITLWLLGGVARIRGEMPSPQVELRVAAAGPVASLLVAALLLAAAVVLGLVGAPPLASGAALWLAAMNGLLAVFNLIPGSPLDGGRILRAILWRVRGDPARAAILAARVGRGAGLLLAGVGLFQLFVAGDSLGGLWTTLVGWFLAGAARREGELATVRAGLGGLRARDVMAPDPPTGPAWFTVDAFLDGWAARHPRPAWPVQDFDGRLAGVVTMDSLRLVPPADRSRVRVADMAVPARELPTAAPDEPAAELAGRLAAAGRSLALVVDGGRPVGVVTAARLAAAARWGQRRPPAAPTGTGPALPGPAAAPGPGQPGVRR